MYDNYNALAGQASSPVEKCVSFTMKDRINEAIRQAEQRLDAAKRAREILAAHPDIEELLNILQRF